MFFLTGLVLKIFLLILMPLVGVLQDAKRVQIKGPFSTPPVFNYSFENYHVLQKKINAMIETFVK
jgi:hypothetical protein